MLSAPVPIQAGGFWQPSGTRQTGLNHCSVALIDFWSLENNPAGMASLKNLSVGLSFQNGYLSPHLGIADAAILYPTTSGNFGMDFRYYGYSLYHKMSIGLSYARKITKFINAGVQIFYLQTGFGDIYGQTSNFTFALGLQANLSKQLLFGIYVFNPLSVHLYDFERIPAVFRFGLSYSFSENLLVTAEAEKNTNIQPVIIRAGIEYIYNKQFAFRLGCGSSGDIFSFGFGWHFQHMQLNIATTMHSSLGFSPGASFLIIF